MTQSRICEHLDAYLAGDLSDEDEADFNAHLVQCPDCHDAVDEQRWIDSLLRSPAGAQLEPTPARVLESFHASKTRRRPIPQAACGLAAAAALLIALTQLTIQSDETPQTPVAVNNVTVTVPAPPAAPAQHATFVSTSDSIAIPLESPAADVTVVQVYPTTDTERRWQLELALPGKLKDTNGG